MLAMLFGDETGADAIVERVRAAEKWDEGWNYWGMGQSGDALSPLDKAIVALGMAGSKGGAGDPGEGRVAGCRVRLLPPSRGGDGPGAVGRPGRGPGPGGTAPQAGHGRPRPRYDRRGQNARRRVCPLREHRPHAARIAPRAVPGPALYRLGDHQGIGEATLRAYAPTFAAISPGTPRRCSKSSSSPRPRREKGLLQLLFWSAATDRRFLECGDSSPLCGLAAFEGRKAAESGDQSPHSKGGSAPKNASSGRAATTGPARQRALLAKGPQDDFPDIHSRLRSMRSAICWSSCGCCNMALRPRCVRQRIRSRIISCSKPVISHFSRERFLRPAGFDSRTIHPPPA